MAQLNLDVNGQTYPIRDLSFICSGGCAAGTCPSGSFSLSQWYSTLQLYKQQINDALISIASAPADFGSLQRLALLQDIAQHHTVGVNLWNNWVSSGGIFSKYYIQYGNCGFRTQEPFIQLYQEILTSITVSINTLYNSLLNSVDDINELSQEVAEANQAIAEANQAMNDAQKSLQEAQAAEFQRKMWTYLIPAVVVIIVLFLLRKRATA